MASDVQIASNALMELGEDPITSFTEESDPAKFMNANYALVRDAVLRDADWNFARVYDQPSLVTAAPLFKWTKQFQLPTDPYCLMVQKVLSADVPVDHEVVGRRVYVNEGAINLIYTSRVEDTAQFDSLFVQALQARLASAAAYFVTGSRSVQADWFQIYTVLRDEARTRDSQEGTPEPLDEDTSLIDVRL